MSRIGKKPILIPQGVEVKIVDATVLVKGPVGQLSLALKSEIKVEHNAEKRTITVTPAAKTPQPKAIWGLYRALISNMVLGVSKGFSKRLLIEGTGYTAKFEKNKLILEVGFAHPVEMKPPEGVLVKTPTTQIIEISGADKQKVGQFAAEVRKIRPPNVYTGKGIKYDGEIVRRKAGKTLISSGGGSGG